MPALLLDTHVWAWSIAGAPMPPAILTAIGNAEAIYVSPISLYEIGYKVRIGKWPAMEPFVDRLAAILHDQGGLSASLTPEICLRAALLDWEHRDPFDRVLAATALVNGWPLASVDTTFDTCPGTTTRIA